MSKQNFDKFINVKVKGAKKKEQIKQEKKSVNIPSSTCSKTEYPNPWRVV